MAKVLETLVICAALVVFAQTGFTIRTQSPNSGIVDGGTVVSIALNNFPVTQTPVTCGFGSEIVPATISSSSSVRCVSPAQVWAGTVQLIVNAGSNTTTNSMSYTYYAKYVVNSVSSPYLAIDSSHNIWVSANSSLPQFLDPAAACVFLINGIEVNRTSATGLSGGRTMQCLTPILHLASPVAGAVAMSVNGQDLSYNVSVLFYPQPLITSVSPSFVLYGMSEVVTIRGSGFFQNKQTTAGWYLNGLGGTTMPVTYVDDNTMLSTAPAMTASYSITFFTVELSFDRGTTYGAPGTVQIIHRCQDLYPCDQCTAARPDGHVCGWCSSIPYCGDFTNSTSSACLTGEMPVIDSTQCGSAPPPPPNHFVLIVSLSSAGGAAVICAIVVGALCWYRRRARYLTVV